MGGPRYLRKVLQEIEIASQNGQRLLCVFDLDSTLFDVSPRLERILYDFAVDPTNKEKFPDSVAVLANIKMLKSDWGIKNALIRAGLDSHHPDFHHAIRDFWRKSFFSNHYLQYDIPYEGAVEYVQSISKKGVDIVYLTGRDVARMGVGSAQILKKWNFPLDDKNSKLVLKPQQGMDDAEFKSDWFAGLPEGKYHKIWFFENEPANIHVVRRSHQHVEVVFFESTHSGVSEPPSDLPKIMHYLLEDD